MGKAFISCLKWVRRGACKEIPDKIELSKDELKDLLGDGNHDNDDEEGGVDEGESPHNDQQKPLEDVDENEDDDKMEAGDDKDDESNSDDDNDLTEYGLDDYDNEDEETTNVASLAGLTVYNTNENDPYVTVPDEDDMSDIEDVNIKPADNLVLVGKSEDDCSELTVYVYNEDESSLFVHHDIMLPAFPLCVEWLDYDSQAAQESGSFVAVGTMLPQIEIWDLDLVDPVEPEQRLGRWKRTKKRPKSVFEGHTDAVLALAWNRHSRNVLASASADTFVALWDMEQGKPATTITAHSDKVQAIQWHPFEVETLLTGSIDKCVRVFDCKTPSTAGKTWDLDGEVECVVWNHYSPFNFLAATDTGVVWCFDVRADKPVFTLKAHDEATSAMSLSSTMPGCLVTVSADKSSKVWDITDNKPSFIASNLMKMGVLSCLEGNPDSPFVFAVGGEKNGVRVWNVTSNSSVRSRFASRLPAGGVISETHGELSLADD